MGVWRIAGRRVWRRMSLPARGRELGPGKSPRE